MKYRYQSLRNFAARLIHAAGMTEAMADAMAEKLLEADLLGQPTHGLAFLPAYLDRMEGGHIAKAGQVRIVSDRPESFSWDAGRLAGAWVMLQAQDAILARLPDCAAVTATIANCSHIGCLQAYLMPYVSQGYMVTVAATNPGIRSVAPFGGVDPVLTTNPLAHGIPSRTIPILIDFSTSLASNAFFRGFSARGEKLPGPWLLDAQGRLSDDATTLDAKPPGTILPLGGADFGYKGFGAGLFVEAASLALSGHGRRVAPDMYGQSVFIHAINPAFFAGQAAFLDEIDLLIRDCKASRPRPGGTGVRLPGERALQSRARQLEQGVDIAPASQQRLAPWLQKLGHNWPDPI